MKSSFNSWLTKCFDDFCKSTSKDEDFIPRLELSYMKPIHARWVINAFNIMKERKEIIIDAWKLSGLHDVIKNAHDGVELIYPSRLEMCPQISQSNESDDEEEINHIEKSRREYRIIDEENTFAVKFEPFILRNSEMEQYWKEIQRSKSLVINGTDTNSQVDEYGG